MKRLTALLGIILFGAGCASSGGVTVPYGTTQEMGDISTPIVGYQPDSDLSRVAKQQAEEQAPMKEDYKNIGPKPTETTMNTTWTFPGKLPDDQLLKKTAIIETVKGTIEVNLFGDEAPLATSNFIYLSKGGYYNGLTFHRREEGFVIQGGDPRGNGTGGPGYQFKDEPVKRQYTRGIVAMANAGPNTNGSQFFIMLDDVPLPPKYTIFGEVTKGLEVVDAIRVGDTMKTITIK